MAIILQLKKKRCSFKKGGRGDKWPRVFPQHLPFTHPTRMKKSSPYPDPLETCSVTQAESWVLSIWSKEQNAGCQWFFPWAGATGKLCELFGPWKYHLPDYRTFRAPEWVMELGPDNLVPWKCMRKDLSSTWRPRSLFCARGIMSALWSAATQGI